jgi:hypothetical protein
VMENILWGWVPMLLAGRTVAGRLLGDTRSSRPPEAVFSPVPLRLIGIRCPDWG